eukprot:NODE_16792_length_349_cov_19.306306_g16769_i0.p1 GENE.NODE_16792_length_349_cov_19.306306_g16769_i0~~NODE_16792_length_349_cov_19.306306_g16769_i0.p1  ORF type:complete len:108 (+),score=23.89 NODE_16792_length_349_cov_19.306306_g16769_i0:48-326(+)
MDVCSILDRRSAHLTLLRLLKLANHKDMDTQRECANALQKIVLVEGYDHMKTAIRAAVGTNLYRSLQMLREFDLDSLKQFRVALSHEDNEYV